MNRPASLAPLLLSVSPTFLLQSMQPMSDVPVTAAWLAALLLARRPSPTASALAGLVASLAVMIRPNLAPLALFVIVTCATAQAAGSRRRTLVRMLVCAACMLPGIVMLGYIQNARYGSPLGSGYGSFHDLFGLTNIRPNLSRYPRWLTMAHSPFLWLWLLAPLWFRRASARARLFGWIGYGFAAAVIAAYLPYVYFRPDEWSYTRFLLPALPFMLVFAAGVMLSAARRWIPSMPLGAAATLILAIAVWSLSTASSLGVFRIVGRRAQVSPGRAVRARPAASVCVRARGATQRQPQVLLHRPTLRWDLLDRASLDRALRSMRDAGYDPFLVVDAGEDRAFRRRFSGTGQRGVEALAPLATIGNTTVYAFR